jgi:hypothetical protein
VCAACRKADRRIGMFLSRVEDVPEWVAEGVSLFILSSDQIFYCGGAALSSRDQGRRQRSRRRGVRFSRSGLLARLQRGRRRLR